MTAWRITEILANSTFLFLWLGFAICLVSTLIIAFRHPQFWAARIADRSVAMSEIFRQSGTFLRHSKTGRVANALLILGTISLVLTAGVAVYALITSGKPD